ncbi:MAG: histidine phosphatase family protein [Acidimicrobiales bacterium]
MRTLHLLRHAKSDWSDASLADRARPLNRRGRRARRTIADHVTGWHVDLVVTSDAARAMATAAPVVAALGCELRIEPRLYDDGDDAAGLLAVVRELADETPVVLMVGHNPGIEQLADLLAGGAPAFPTAALATLELAVARWAEAAPGTATLTAFVTARTLDEGDGSR